jgi:hypothetical protein
LIDKTSSIFLYVKLKALASSILLSFTKFWRNSDSYATLHDKLKTRLKETIHKAFSHRNDGSKCVVLGYNSTYFSNKIQKGKTSSNKLMIPLCTFLCMVSYGV